MPIFNVSAEEILKQEAHEIAIQRLALDRKKHEDAMAANLLQQEIDREKNLSDNNIKLQEIKSNSGTGFSFTTSQASIIAALLALLGGAIGVYIQGYSLTEVERNKSNALISIEMQKNDANIKIERQKFESALILKSFETPNKQERISNLKFFANIGILSDPDEKIRRSPDDQLPRVTSTKTVCTGQFREKCPGANDVFIACPNRSEEELVKLVCSSPGKLSPISVGLTGNNCGYSLFRATCNITN